VGTQRGVQYVVLWKRRVLLSPLAIAASVPVMAALVALGYADQEMAAHPLSGR